jgi:PAS domain S-box-containing protein
MNQDGWQILLIDDDRDDYFLIKTMLSETRQVGYHLEWASSYPAGIQSLKNKTYDIVLVDNDLGVYVGLDLIREFIKSGYGSPMILLTGRGSYEVDLQAMQAGAADYLNKNDLNAALLERSIRFAIERRRSEEVLRESEQRFHIALQNTPIVVFTQDAELRYTWIHNPRAGFDREQVLGKRDDELLDSEAAAILTALKRLVLESRQSLRQEVTYRIGSQMVVYDLTLEPLRDQAGTIVGLTGAAMDLTDLRRLEQEQIAYAAQMEVQRRLIQQRELERMDIARDLHDGLLQEMTAIGFALAEAMSTEEKQARMERLSWVRDHLQKQSSEVRTFCNELRPPALAPFGLEKAIRSHVEEYQKRHSDLLIHLNLQADQQRLSEETRMALFRIYQESLNNITKHSKASQASISLLLDDDEACLEIEDNGIGFELSSDWVAQARSGHLGLLGMRERVQSIGGEIEFASQPGQGMEIRVIIPRR